MSIKVNDEPTPLRMKLGHAGEAFFEEEVIAEPAPPSRPFLTASTPRFVCFELCYAPYAMRGELLWESLEKEK